MPTRLEPTSTTAAGSRWRKRLDFACHRLADGRESLAAIALAAGFADQSHFTRLFRRQMGMTPAAYRAALRAGK